MQYYATRFAGAVIFRWIITRGATMTDIKKIKIVKKLEASATKVRKRKIDTPRKTAREMVSTVSGWVSDIKARKSEETRAAFDSLFSANPRPSES